MIYKTDDGELIQGSSPTEVLMDLKNGSRFEAHLELEEYLDGLLLRLEEYYGILITRRQHDHMLDDMVTIGFLERVE